ncbi:hypothetical protein OS493_002139 [Desmophyllum pertusum]|uniref:Secreted protein n=1 Tax=Desmophyllum pertusum TaxID=174260 RepID=A0A9W9Z5M0_9CNID|nr:hypothetical protein OS493_002139 [Desmophyllum pertusum]
MSQMFVPIAVLLLPTVLCVDVDHVARQYWPCQIQSFFAREYGSGEGNLLRVHLNNNGAPTNVTFTGSCDSATLKFTKFIEERRVINGSFEVSFRWAVNNHYVLTVKQGTLVMKFSPKARKRKAIKGFSNIHWFILKSCDACYPGMNRLETLSKPHLYVKSDSSGSPFMDPVTGRMAWFEIMNSACSEL